MPFANLLLRARSRKIWRDPVRTVLTLESFSRTEADGGKDIGSAAGKVADDELRGHLRRHTADELRHAELFRTRAAQLRSTLDLPTGTGSEAEDSAYDLSRGRPAAEVDAHGFFTSGLLDELGEVAYVAMLHAAEKRAAQLFTVHRDLTRHDPETCAVFEEILRDEQYHVAYTRTILEKWSNNGRASEVAAAKSGARGGHFWSAWKRTGIRSGAAFSRGVLHVLYLTLLLPFGLFARRGAVEQGWADIESDASSGNSSKPLRSQY
ncbi:MAG: hypothetical protein DHS20C15_34440 [Planctomycetota bacterium]|nr:MAG: hypothetical protein DHS20C15_34440 [Planctomycetota bacterium]